MSDVLKDSIKLISSILDSQIGRKLCDFLLQRKIVNGISVDKKGECYCPRCGKWLIINDPKEMMEKMYGVKSDSLSHFSCSSKGCSLINPIEENGEKIDAKKFREHQKKWPQEKYKIIAE